MGRIILIDGNPLMWRAVYAQNERYVTEGILTYFFDILDKFDCSRVLALWDSGKSRWRTNMYPAYKASREGRKDKVDLKEMGIQKKEAKRILEYFGVKHITVPGVEADDMIAWLAKYFAPTNKVLIASRDKDLWQLINNKVTMFDPLSNTLVQPEDVKDELGIPPSLIPDWKALVGDPSDNIKGVKGIGNKTALKLIDQYANIEGLLDPANSKKLQTTKTSGKVVTNSHDLEHSYQLVKLPALLDMGHFLNEQELTVLKEELEKPLGTDALKAQVELELLGNYKIRRRFVEDLSTELVPFVQWVDKSLEDKRRVVKYEDFGQYSADLSVCRSCILVDCVNRKQPVGPSNAKVMVLGRNIDNNDLLDELLVELSIKKESCWITEVCKCSSGYRPLLYSSIEACSKFLKEELRLVKPKLIISLGCEAMSVTTPNNYDVSAYVGSIEEQVIGDHTCFVAVLPNPNDVVKYKGNRAEWDFGVGKIKEFLDKRRNK